MPTGSNIELKMDPLPIPDEAPVKAEEDRARQNLQQTNRMPPGAGFASKGAQFAHVADSILQGWMGGRAVKRERELQKAKGEVTSSKSIYDSLAETYRQNVAAGKDPNDPEMKKAAENITSAWNNYVNTADKYTSPEDEKGGKKKGGVKEHVGKMFGMDVDPELFRKGSVNILKQSGPPVLREPMSAQDQAAKLGLDEAKKEAQRRDAEQKTKDDWKNLVAIDPAKRTPEQQKELESLERKMLGPESKEQQVKEQFYTDMTEAAKAGKPLDESKKKLYQDMGLMSKENPSISTLVDNRGHVQMLAVSPDGKSVVTTEVKDKNGRPLQERVPEDQVSVMKRIHDYQFNSLVKEYETAYASPNIDKNELHQQATKFAMSAMTGFKLLGANPVEAQENQFRLSKAIKAVIGEVPKKDQAIFKNFASNPDDNPDGTFMYRTSAANPLSPEVKRWYWADKPAGYYGGLSKDELEGQEAAFRTRLLAALRKQNPKMSDEQVRALMPPPIYQGMPQQNKPAPQMTAPPAASGSPSMSAPPQAAPNYGAYADDGKGNQMGFNLQTKQWEPVRAQ